MDAYPAGAYSSLAVSYMPKLVSWSARAFVDLGHSAAFLPVKGNLF